MNVKKFLLIAMLFVLAIAAVACATPTAEPTKALPTVAPKATDMPKPTDAPKPTVAPTKAAEPTKPAPTTAPMAAAFDAKAALDKYFSAIPDGYYNIAPAAANDQMKATKTFLLDLREVSEITTNGWVEGETNIPTRTLIKNLDKLPADKAAPILVMCGSGVRSPMGMVALQLLGYTNVKNVQGGFGAWKTANLPVKTEGQPAAPMAGTAIAADKDLVAALDKFFSGLPDGFNNTQPATINDQIKATKVVLIDVREASEFATGTIEGAVSVPVRTLIKNLDKLPADKSAPVVLICASGHRGMMSIVALNMLGYTNVKNLAGGLNAWKAANLPVAGAPASTTMALDLKTVSDKYFTALPDGFSMIAPAAAKDQMAATKVFLLDLREPSEITTNGFVEGAINIPTRTLMKNLDKLPAKDQPIIVMCGSGVRSPLGMAALQMLGYTNVKSLTGGFNGWKTANLPIKTEGKPADPVAGKAPEVDKELLAAFDKWFTALPDGWNGIAPAAANDQMKATKVTLIDVREASEITANGKIEGSINIPVRTLIKSLDKLPADKAAPILVTCQSGHRGMFSMMALQMLGYTNVKNISGGINAWKAANLPVVGAPAAATAFDAKAALDKYFSAIPDGYYNIAPAAANDQMKATKTFLLDLREASEITANGWVEGETNIPTRSLIKNLDKLPADKAAPILVMCGSGVRSPMGMVGLQLLGYTNVKNVQGGFGAWKTANLPVKTEGQPPAPMAGTAIAADKDLVAALDKFFTGLPDGFNNAQSAAINDQIKATKVALIDVREASEFATGKLEGSVSVPVRTLIKTLDKLPADKTAPVVLICASGHRGMMSIVALNMLGYTNVKNLAGGVNAWKTANLPVVP